MFGYIIPDKPEMKIKEYELFKAYYCGLCKSIKKHYGQIPRFALSYDLTFLALFLSSISTLDTDIKITKCINKPLKKFPIILDNDILKYAASANVIFAYYKLKDDIEDSKGYKKLPLIPILHPSYKKASKNANSLDKYTKHHLLQLTGLEKNLCNSIDAAGEPFANLLAETFSQGSLFANKTLQQTLKDFGYNIGKWLYTIDALDDISEDLKRDNYNPIVAQFYNGHSRPQEFKESIKENVGFVLYYSLKQACQVYEGLDIKKNKPILDNIIYGGMYNKTHEVLEKEIDS